MACDLFSVKAATATGNTVNFGQGKCWIRDKHGDLRGVSLIKDKVYKLKCEHAVCEHPFVLSEGEKYLDLWNQRLGHVGEQML